MAILQEDDVITRGVVPSSLSSGGIFQLLSPHLTRADRLVDELEGLQTPPTDGSMEYGNLSFSSPFSKGFSFFALKSANFTFRGIRLGIDSRIARINS
jgi:hypothetical protein